MKHSTQIGQAASGTIDTLRFAFENAHWQLSKMVVGERRYDDMVRRVVASRARLVAVIGETATAKIEGAL